MNKKIGLDLGTCKISATRTKYFFQKDGRELEFYVDYDPKTGLSSLWIRPGYIDAMADFILALMLEFKRAELKSLGLDK